MAKFKGYAEGGGGLLEFAVLPGSKLAWIRDRMGGSISISAEEIPRLIEELARIQLFVARFEVRDDE